MKKFALLFAVLSLCVLSSAQTKIPKLSDEEIAKEFSAIKDNFKESSTEWVFSKVINAEGKKASELYTKALEVLASVYVDAKDVIQSADKEAGVIIGKGFVNSSARALSAFNVCLYRSWQIVKIELKDERYRVSVTTTEYEAQVSGSVSPNFFNGSTLPINKLYPYNEAAEGKGKYFGWDVLKFIYDAGNTTIATLESEMTKKLSVSDDW